MKFKVFVDGQHGTTGLKIHQMLENRDEIELLTIEEKDKKNIQRRKELLNSADLVFLCLPDDAAKESVSLIENDSVKVIDASTAHRTNPDWVYGIPELTSKQRDKIKYSKRVCVPGCHASGLIVSMKPLFKNKILSKNHKLICHSITGFSGGGSSMINEYENGSFEVFGGQRPYALGLNHKHLPEMKYVLKINKAPIFTPSVGNFKQGMLVISYIEKKKLRKQLSKEALIRVYQEYYNNESFIKVIENTDEYLENGFLNPMRCNNTNSLEISVYDNKTDLVVISRLDNLGKGASGAAIQCMNIMLGLEEKKGLEIKL
ncbi:N-acetyl-gamma-glutamyl-phosphate reductase [Aliarcobacter lanthieri]|uniref:N-acetyl-gamma-glutamyl-phosphate reductase n=1 Tax=Aliarcobacter lanthieri TaxID=1355374 RepID=UPI00047D9CD0|nr:N-acetyl-gamma-glutamyl-phosphate reductase [Aliarcobacter lanthieri]QKF59526.1 N-acetyl-gamma-glutamylphosphate reductase, uncommon form [Aliarcobacter lanthieri]